MYVNESVIKINGHTLLLRNAEEKDAEMLLKYLKTVCDETKFLMKNSDEIALSLEDEREFINNQNKSECNLLLLGFLDGEHIGNCSFTGTNLCRYKHRVNMGIALYQKYTGMGLGKIMIEKLFSIAKEKGFEQIELEVVADNKRAISLYEKLGFEVFGTFPNNLKYKDGTYANSYWMMKKL